jgi:hypothetical protein
VGQVYASGGIEAALNISAINQASQRVSEKASF